MSILNTTLDTVSPTAPKVILTQTFANAVTAIYLCNTSASQIVVDVHIVTSGGTADGTNKVYHQLQIAANDTYVIDTERVVLGINDFIAVQPSIAWTLGSGGVVATASYVRI